MADDQRAVALITAPQDQAKPIAEAIVDRQLVACVNIVPVVQSVYRWEGKVETDDEALLVVKTTHEAVPSLDEALAELHPYDTYELVILPIADGNQDYLSWITDSVVVSR